MSEVSVLDYLTVLVVVSSLLPALAHGGAAMAGKPCILAVILMLSRVDKSHFHCFFTLP